MSVEETAFVRVGLIVSARKGQRYQCIELEPYTRVDGEKILLAVWQSECRVCDVGFNQKSSARVVGMDNFVRTCEDHRGLRQRINP